MNIDTLMFENYLDQLILEDTALIYESGMNGKIKLVAKITLAISATALLILVAKKIKKYVENKRDEEQIDSTINSLKKTRVKLFKLKGEAKKVVKAKENEKKIASTDIFDTKGQVSNMYRKALHDKVKAVDQSTTLEEMREISETYSYIMRELDETENRLWDMAVKNQKISEEDSKWLKNTMKDVKNYMRGRE